MMMGTATELVEPHEEVKFYEDMTAQERAIFYKEK
jgi:hypothetical protein